MNQEIKIIALCSTLFLSLSGLIYIFPKIVILFVFALSKPPEPILLSEIVMDDYNLKIYANEDILGDPTCDMFIRQEKKIAANQFITQDFPLENNNFCHSYEYSIPAQNELILWGTQTTDLTEKPQKYHFKFKPDFDY